MGSLKDGGEEDMKEKQLVMFVVTHDMHGGTGIGL
jgi:uncharacterized damage-inducible protein DinB